MNRRKFIKGISAVGALGLFSGLYAWQIEPFWLEFVQLKMPIKHLPKKLVGSTLMQISDIHVGNRFDRKFIIDSFKKAKDYQPEFVVYTGDFVSYDTKEQLEQLTLLVHFMCALYTFFSFHSAFTLNHSN